MYENLVSGFSAEILSKFSPRTNQKFINSSHSKILQHNFAWAQHFIHKSINTQVNPSWHNRDFNKRFVMFSVTVLLPCGVDFSVRFWSALPFQPAICRQCSFAGLGAVRREPYGARWTPKHSVISSVALRVQPNGGNKWKNGWVVGRRCMKSGGGRKVSWERGREKREK